MSCRLLRARRKSTGCASASSSRAAKPRRWRRSWKKKSSSSPGLPASARLGVLLALSFPKFGHPAFSWLALAPLLVALAGDKPTTRRAFLLGLTTGVVYFTGTLYWITRVMALYGGLPAWVAVILNAALVAYLALFPAVFAVVMGRGLVAFGARALAAAPLVWVATELGRTHILTGFPWVLLGYSQAEVLPMAQLASLFGVYGVSTLSPARAPWRRTGSWLRAGSGSAAAGGSSSPS